MITNTYFLLYVENPMASADFYSRLLDKQPVQASADFTLFILDSGIKLGLWSRQVVKPEAQASVGGGELGWPWTAAKRWMNCTSTGGHWVSPSSSPRPPWGSATPCSPLTPTGTACECCT